MRGLTIRGELTNYEPLFSFNLGANDLCVRAYGDAPLQVDRTVVA